MVTESAPSLLVSCKRTAGLSAKWESRTSALDSVSTKYVQYMLYMCTYVCMYCEAPLIQASVNQLHCLS